MQIVICQLTIDVMVKNKQSLKIADNFNYPGGWTNWCFGRHLKEEREKDKGLSYKTEVTEGMVHKQ